MFKPRRRPTKRPRYTTTQPTTAQSHNTYKYTTTAASAPTASYYYKYPTVKYHTTASPGPTISYYYKDIAVDSHSSSTSSYTVSTESTTGSTTEHTSTKSARKGKRISLTNINDLNEDIEELMLELEMMNGTTTTSPANTTSTTAITTTNITPQNSTTTTATTTTAITASTTTSTTTTSPTTTTTETIPTPSPIYFKQYPTSSTTTTTQTIPTPSPVFFKQFKAVAQKPPILPLLPLAAVTEKAIGSALPSSNTVQSSPDVIKDIEADKKRNRMALSQLNNEIQSLQIELQRLRDSRTKSVRKGKTISSANINDLNEDIEELMSEVKMMKASFKRPKVLQMTHARLPSLSPTSGPSPVESQRHQLTSNQFEHHVHNFPAPPANSFNVANSNFPEPPVDSFHGGNPNFPTPPVNSFDVANPLYFEHVSENHGYQGQSNPFHQSSQLHPLQVSHNTVPRPQGSYSYIQHGHSRTPIYHGLPRYR